MSDRLTLANAIEEAGIDRAKAERVAAAIVDLIHDNAATAADVTAAATAVRLRTSMVRKADIAAVRADLTVIEHRLLTRLGVLMVVVAGALFAALDYWPPGDG